MNDPHHPTPNTLPTITLEIKDRAGTPTTLADLIATYTTRYTTRPQIIVTTSPHGGYDLIMRGRPTHAA